jgi:hypothetical protein
MKIPVVSNAIMGVDRRVEGVARLLRTGNWAAKSIL